MHTDGFDEDGEAGLTSRSDDMQVTYSTLGTRATLDVELGGINTTVNGMLGWRHAGHDVTPTATHTFAHGPNFSVSGTPIAQDTALVETGLDINLTDTAALGVTYRGQIASEAEEHGLTARFKFKF
ncbi:autotransporter outer membrane beta-barrel domain-containing protein [Salinisphaera orenii]|uniref:autotransporter outer membrane beta-barrel domain-containing protein n=1 Tax=Salinisphaera orenii TaxID=856731 RepID=UPI00296F1A19